MGHSGPIHAATARGRAGDISNNEKRLHLFERWAKDYDASLRSSEGFPFAGYEEVLARVVALACLEPGMHILDLGTGTGNLAERFARHETNVWGLDFSSDMLTQAKRKVPSATFLQADLSADWPELPKFERVVSAYVLHEFDMEAKLGILKRSTRHLTADGFLVVADIAFPSADILGQAHKRWQEAWDEDEHYWIADEALAACEEVGLRGTYEQVSSGAGVFVFQSS